MHRPAALVAALLVAALVAVAQADKKKELMPRYIKYTLDCMKEVNADVGMCKEMTQEGTDHTQEKYAPCKCMISCVGKKAKVITDAGDADPDAFTTAVDEFEIPEWSAEWKRVRPLCEPVIKGKKDCVLAYDFLMCGHKESEIFRGVLKKFMGDMDNKS